jgi:hypothetical protein
MKPTTTKHIAAYLAVVAIPLALICFIGVYVTIGDGIFAGLMLQGLFFPPIEKFYLVTNGSNRFLLAPMVQLYKHFPQINWFDVSQLVPGIVTLLLLLYILFTTILQSFSGKWVLIAATIFSALLGVVFAESTVLYDPLSSSLMLPLLVLLLPHYCNHPWAKAGAYLLLTLLLLLCWQIRYQGIFVGLVPAIALLGLLDLSPIKFLNKYKYAMLLIATTFGIFMGASYLQDQNITPEEQKIAELDSYIYTFSDGMVVKPGSYDITDPVDSIKLIAYYTFYFAEPTDTALAYMKNITYPSVFEGNVLAGLPIKWGLFWERAKVDGPMAYQGYNRFMWYMMLGNFAFLLWAVLLAPSKTWIWKALLWTLFVWCYFVSLGVAVKMIYKLAAPLTFFFLFSFVYLALQIWRDRNNTTTDRAIFAIAASFVVLISIVGFQLKTYATIKADRQEGLSLKQEIVTEMNQMFPDKLLVFDFFSEVVLEDEIGADNSTRELLPEATMFGDFYMSLFPTNKQHLEALTGKSDFVLFFKFCASNPDKVVLVMSQHRIDLIKSYLKLVKGVELHFVPLEGDYKIEQLDHSFYEVPLLLNYYQVTFSEPK